jgi:pyruvate formate-lyase activating enzyme-like uncharacterized protein
MDDIEVLKTIIDERFKVIDSKFNERDIRFEQHLKSSKDAIDAALVSTKSATETQDKNNALLTDKTEIGFKSQFDQMNILIATIQKEFNIKLDTVAIQLKVLESLRKGLTNTWILMFVSTVLIILTFIVIFRNIK